MVNQLAVASETTPQKERVSQNKKFKRFVAKAAMASVCAIPAADLALSDATTAKVYQATKQEINTRSNFANHAIRDGIIGGSIMAESVLLGFAIGRSRKLKGAYSEQQKYLQTKRQEMSRPRLALSKVANAPLTVLSKVGGVFERAGEKVGQSQSKTAQTIGKAAIDAGQVNAMGTSAVILQETLKGKPITAKRNLWLGSLIGGSWIATVELAEKTYQKVPVLRPPMNFVGEAFQTLTDVNVAKPWASPVATSAVSLAAFGLAYSGWKIAEHQEQGLISAEIENKPAETQV